jgi:hypothetical protein
MMINRIRTLSTRQFSSHAKAAVGFRIPGDLKLTEDSPGTVVTTQSLFAGKKVAGRDGLY